MTSSVTPTTFWESNLEQFHIVTFLYISIGNLGSWFLPHNTFMLEAAMALEWIWTFPWVGTWCWQQWLLWKVSPRVAYNLPSFVVSYRWGSKNNYFATHGTLSKVTVKRLVSRSKDQDNFWWASMLKLYSWK